jgi:hypothetical protein
MSQLHSSVNAMRAWKKATAALEDAARRDAGERRVLDAYQDDQARLRRGIRTYQASCAPARVSSEASK